VNQAPGDAVVYKGLPVDEVKQREMAEKIASALAVLFTILAAATGQREDPPASPPGSGSFRVLQLSIVLPLLLLPTFATTQAGCGSLSPATVSPGSDPLVVDAERSIAASFDTVDAFLAAEHDNRDALRQDLPAVHALAEQLRRDAPNAFAEAKAAVRLYKQTRTTSDGDAMDAKLARVQSLARTARQALIRVQAR
jgi:hypothetical protein